MEINPLLLIAGGLGLMFFGYFFGLFEGRGQGYKKRKAEEVDQEKQAVLDRAVSAPTSVTHEPSTPAPVPDDPGILRLKDQGGALHVELDGRLLRAASISPVQRKRLIEVVTRLRPWIEARPVESPPSPPPTPVSGGVSSKASASGPDPAKTASPAAAIAAIDETEQPLPAKSMVAQIDEILQKNIADTPLAGRGIRIVDAPGGGVTVFVGMERYSSVGDVTDPEVQGALRNAIATWEKKYTPGL